MFNSIIGRSTPFYGVQFHPEKPAYEWTPIEGVPHEPEAIFFSQHFSNFFASEARKNSNHFANYEEELDWTIYKEKVIDMSRIALKSHSQLLQIYVFDH